jgi:phospholipase/carboxylesterase
MGQLNADERQFGSLQTVVVDALPDGAAPSLLVILSHGFGAPGDDLVGLGAALLDGSPQLARSCRFVFPAAPHDLGVYGMPGGRAWWLINMARLMQMQQTRDFAALTQHRPPGMTEATAELSVAVREMQREWGLQDDQLVIGGFSQGAMVSTSLVLESGLRPALLVLFSGSLLDAAHWQQLAERHGGCDVLLSHGSEDDILPESAGLDLADLLQRAGFRVDLRRFRGGHTIPMAVLEALGSHLDGLVSGDGDRSEG